MKTIAALALVLACASAFAATAYWTGSMTQVTTVTFQIAWRCEYQYLGQKFYRIFRDSCPSTVEVE